MMVVALREIFRVVRKNREVVFDRHRFELADELCRGRFRRVFELLSRGVRLPFAREASAMRDEAGPSEAIDALREELSRFEPVELALLFGSASEAEASGGSDIDIAIKFREEVDRRQRFRELCALSGRLRSSGRPFVDVADLERLPIDIARATVHGTLIQGDERRLHTVREQIESEFEERRDEIRDHQRSVIERIAECGLHGR